MFVRTGGVAVLAALMATASAYAEEVPSNAELFRMLKDQQKTISELRAELKQARQDLRAGNASQRRDVETAAKQAGREAAREAVAAANPMQAHAAYTKAPALPAAPNRFTVTGEYLALKAGVGDTSFVAMGTANPGSNPGGVKFNNDPDFSSAYRVGVGYEFGGSNRAINASYTHLKEMATKSVSGSQLFGTVGAPDFAVSFLNFPGAATSQIAVSFDRADLMFSEPIKWSDTRIALLYGLEYARIGLREDIGYSNAVGIGTLGTITNTATTWGIGPKIGVSVDHDLVRNSAIVPGVLSVNATSTGGVLYAKTNSATLQTRVTAAGVLGAVDADVTSQSSFRLIPTVQARGGFTYTFPMMGYLGALSIGYEFNTYIGAITRDLFADDVADGWVTKRYDNFDLSGPYANLKMKF